MKNAITLCLIVLLSIGLVACGGNSSDTSRSASSSDTAQAASPAPAATVESDGHQLAGYLQHWASGYQDNNATRLFTGVVSVDDDGTTFKVVTNSDEWASLDSDAQDGVKNNAMNAVYESYCLISSHKNNLVPGIAVQFVDDSGNPLDTTVTGPGHECSRY